MVWGGFFLHPSHGPSHRAAADFSAWGCPQGTELCTAHYFSIRNLRLSKNFPPFGRRVAVRHFAQKAHHWQRRHPMGCQIGRLTRHETPLPVARPSQATKISKPNRFAYPFRSRPRGVRGAPILNLRPHQAPSYRDTSTANLGLGVTPRRGPCSKIPSTLSSRRITHLQSLAPENAFQVGSAAVKAQPVHS